MNERESIKAVISRNLRYYRRLKKLSQEKLSLACGLHHTYIGFLERLEYNPSALTLEKIAVVLEIDESQLLDRTRKD